MKLFTFSPIFILSLSVLSGCAFTPVFHNTADTELKMFSESLTNMRLEDLFRQHPTLKLIKSTDIGNSNMRHEFSYATTEKEDGSQRPSYANGVYLFERELVYSINIFVDASGIIYEVLDPVLNSDLIKKSNKRYDRWQKESSPPATKSQYSDNVPML